MKIGNCLLAIRVGSRAARILVGEQLAQARSARGARRSTDSFKTLFGWFDGAFADRLAIVTDDTIERAIGRDLLGQPLRGIDVGRTGTVAFQAGQTGIAGWFDPPEADQVERRQQRPDRTEHLAERTTANHRQAENPHQDR